MPQSNVEREIERSLTSPSKNEITSLRAEAGSHAPGFDL